MDKLDEEEVKQINDMIDANMSDLDIAKSFSCSRRTVYAIRRNRYNPHHNNPLGELTSIINLIDKQHCDIMSKLKQLRKRIEDERKT